MSLGDVQASTPNVIDSIFRSAWGKISAGEAIVCAKTATRFDPLPVPEAIIIDVSVSKLLPSSSFSADMTPLACSQQFFAVEPVRVIRKLSGKSTKIFSWMSGGTNAMFYLFGPENLGGRGNIAAKVDAEVKRTGRPFAEVVVEVRTFVAGRCALWSDASLPDRRWPSSPRVKSSRSLLCHPCMTTSTTRRR